MAKTKKLALMAMLTAASLIVFVIEAQIPAPLAPSQEKHRNESYDVGVCPRAARLGYRHGRVYGACGSVSFDTAGQKSIIVL